ncbi:MAG: DUF512 domain-containing protein [Oscillospiraceae bacterium]|nr:DUF512 domain-containing protein [Oscillospiraceae bacterium]
MAVKITGITPGSPAERAKIQSGDVLISINKNAITDVLDYRFYMTDTHLDLLLHNEAKEVRTVSLRKGEYDDLGLEFETYLMDKQMGCHNKCIFCFVDQTPKGMRPSLYFKDDDTRMSFLFGNYTTLTNLKDGDIERIIKMHISPINISVHTTNPDLRVEMMGNRYAGEKLRYIKMLTDNGIKVNSQLVLCPGINDGEELERSIRDLSALCPNLQSIAVVPVGLTKHREGLYPLRCFTAEEAKQVVETTERWGDLLAQNNESRIVYASDEFYLLAGLPILEPEFYGDFDQLDNGVGLMALLEQEFNSALLQAGEFNEEKQITIATGELAYPMLCRFAQKIMDRFPTVKVGVEKIVNDFFGHTVTVAGLVTGQDLIAQLKGKDLGAELLIPSTMLRHEQDRFLDDVTREEVEEALSVTLITTENDGFDLLEKILSPVIWE